MTAKPLRIAIGSLMQETNTLVPFKTTLETFRATYIRRGREVIDGYGAARVEVPGFLSVLRAAGAEAVPLIAAHAMSGGFVTRQAFDTLVDELVERLKAALPVDGVLLALHGAMAIEDEPDGEAEILERVRAALPGHVPIGVSLDLHGHITPRMLQPNVFLIGYREYPHIDMFETGERVAQLLLEVLSGNRRPVMTLAKRHMIVSPVRARTGIEPLSRIVAAARALEASGAILHASLFPVQPWLDLPDLGFAALVCADGDTRRAQQAADRLADMAWAARDEFEPDLVPLEDAIRTGLAEPGTTVVGDAGDGPSGGAAADNATVLRTLLAMGADKAGRLTYLTLCDAAAARAAAAAGPGATVTLKVGHSLSPADGAPLSVVGIVRTISDGVFTMHDAGAQGTVTQLGLTVVLAIGDIRLAIRSQPSFEWDTGLFAAFGLELRHAALVFVKSPSHFRTAFAPHAARILIADTPGPTCGNMRRLTLTRVTRPLFPLDDLRNDRAGATSPHS
jgi:microcystin degradation protein MlrC